MRPLVLCIVYIALLFHIVYPINAFTVVPKYSSDEIDLVVTITNGPAVIIVNQQTPNDVNDWSKFFKIGIQSCTYLINADDTPTSCAIGNDHGITCIVDDIQAPQQSDVHIHCTTGTLLNGLAFTAAFYLQPGENIIQPEPDIPVILHIPGIELIGSRQETSIDDVYIYTLHIRANISPQMVTAFHQIFLHEFNANGKPQGPFTLIKHNIVINYTDIREEDGNGEVHYDTTIYTGDDYVNLTTMKMKNYDNFTLSFEKAARYYIRLTYSFRRYYLNINQPGSEFHQRWNAVVNFPYPSMSVSTNIYSSLLLGETPKPFALMSSGRISSEDLVLSANHAAITEYFIDRPAHQFTASSASDPLVPGDCLRILLPAYPPFMHHPECVMTIEHGSHVSTHDFIYSSQDHRLELCLSFNLENYRYVFDEHQTFLVRCTFSLNTAPQYTAHDGTLPLVDESIWVPSIHDQFQAIFVHESESFPNLPMTVMHEQYRISMVPYIFAAGLIDGQEKMPALLATFICPHGWLDTSISSFKFTIGNAPTDSDHPPAHTAIIPSCAFIEVYQGEENRLLLESFYNEETRSISGEFTPFDLTTTSETSIAIICDLYRPSLVADVHQSSLIILNIDVELAQVDEPDVYFKHELYPRVTIQQDLHHLRVFDFILNSINDEPVDGKSIMLSTHNPKALIDFTLTSNIQQLIYHTDTLFININGSYECVVESTLDQFRYPYQHPQGFFDSNQTLSEVTIPTTTTTVCSSTDVSPCSPFKNAQQFPENGDRIIMGSIVLNVKCTVLFHLSPPPPSPLSDNFMKSLQAAGQSVVITYSDIDHESSQRLTSTPTSYLDTLGQDAIKIPFTFVPPHAECLWKQYLPDAEHNNNNNDNTLITTTQCYPDQPLLACPDDFPCGTYCQFTMTCHSPQDMDDGTGTNPISTHEFSNDDCQAFTTLYERLDRTMVAKCPQCPDSSHYYGEHCDQINAITKPMLQSIDDLPISDAVHTYGVPITENEYRLVLTYTSSIMIQWEYIGTPHAYVSIFIQSPSFHPLKSALVATVLATDRTYQFTLADQLPQLSLALHDIELIVSLGIHSQPVTKYPSNQQVKLQLDILPKCRSITNGEEIATCLNGGICIDNGQCQCPHGFTGHTCEQPEVVDQCKQLLCIQSNTYAHHEDNEHGECIINDSNPGEDTLRCNCLPEYFGAQCQHELRCEHRGCQEGRLLSPSGRPDECKCHCNTEYIIGETCNQCRLPCQNGGVANTRCTQCECKAGYIGLTCNIPVWYHNFTLRNLPQHLVEMIIDASSASGSVANQYLALLQQTLVNLLLSDYTRALQSTFIIINDDDNSTTPLDTSKIAVRVEFSKFDMVITQANPNAPYIYIQLMLYPAEMTDAIHQYTKQYGLHPDWNKITNNLDFFKQFLKDEGIYTDDNIDDNMTNPDIDDPGCLSDPACHQPDGGDEESSNGSLTYGLIVNMMNYSVILLLCYALY